MKLATSCGARLNPSRLRRMISCGSRLNSRSPLVRGPPVVEQGRGAEAEALRRGPARAKKLVSQQQIARGIVRGTDAPAALNPTRPPASSITSRSSVAVSSVALTGVLPVEVLRKSMPAITAARAAAVIRCCSWSTPVSRISFSTIPAPAASRAASTSSPTRPTSPSMMASSGATMSTSSAPPVTAASTSATTSAISSPPCGKLATVASRTAEPARAERAALSWSDRCRRRPCRLHGRGGRGLRSPPWSATPEAGEIDEPHDPPRQNSVCRGGPGAFDQRGEVTPRHGRSPAGRRAGAGRGRRRHARTWPGSARG